MFSDSTEKFYFLILLDCLCWRTSKWSSGTTGNSTAHAKCKISRIGKNWAVSSGQRFLEDPTINYSLSKKLMEDLKDKSSGQRIPKESNSEIKSNFPIFIKGCFRAMKAKEKSSNPEDSDVEIDDDLFKGFDEFFGDKSSHSQRESKPETTNINEGENDSKTDTASDQNKTIRTVASKVDLKRNRRNRLDSKIQNLKVSK